MGVSLPIDAVKQTGHLNHHQQSFSSRSEFEMQDPNISNATLNISSNAACTGYTRRSVLVEFEQTIQLIPANGCYDAMSTQSRRTVGQEQVF
jgi:hypothetical protein